MHAVSNEAMRNLAATDLWLVRPRPSAQAGTRLFCFPPAGGGAATYRRWAGLFSSTIEPCLVQLPGRETRFLEPPIDRLPPLVDALVQGLGPYFVRPFAFFGHSMGALVSFELARQLRRIGGGMPVHLFLSGKRAPQMPLREPPIHALPETAFCEALRRLNGTPRVVLDNQELMALLLPTLRADFAVHETYRFGPEEPLDIPISVFGGHEDPLAKAGELGAWRDHTRTSFHLHMFPGDHFFINTAETSIVEIIERELHQQRV
jgi:medium-chain acyl-[acyl-carrier-protein] hydrolase